MNICHNYIISIYVNNIVGTCILISTSQLYWIYLLRHYQLVKWVSYCSFFVCYFKNNCNCRSCCSIYVSVKSKGNKFWFEVEISSSYTISIRKLVLTILNQYSNWYKYNLIFTSQWWPIKYRKYCKTHNLIIGLYLFGWIKKTNIYMTIVSCSTRE